MKSLEILDLYLKVAEEEMEEDKVKDAIKNNLNQIKQDLEVLEIIKNKRVIVHLVITALNNCNGNVEEALKYHNDYKGNFYDQFLTLEELLKLKQWLEVNENED